MGITKSCTHLHPAHFNLHPAPSTSAQLISASTQLHPPPPNSFQPPPSSIYLHPTHFSLHPALCNILSCPFWLEIGTQGISRMLILIPTLLFSVFNAKSIFGKIWAKKFQLTLCSYHVTYVFQSEFTLYSCLNVKELFARSRHEI